MIVERKIGAFFVLKFSNLIDRDFIIDYGPWPVNNSLLVVDKWIPNFLFHHAHHVAFPIWIQIWDLPLEHHFADVEDDIANVIDTSLYPNEPLLFTSHNDYLRVRTLIDPSSSFHQCIHIALDN